MSISSGRCFEVSRPFLRTGGTVVRRCQFRTPTDRLLICRPGVDQATFIEQQVADVKQAVAGEDIASDGRQSYIRVTLRRVNGRPTAYVTGTQSSGALLSMVLADGLLIIPEGVMVARQGESFAVRVLRVLMV